MLGETYITGLVVCSEYGYEGKKPSPWHASSSRIASFPFHNTAIKTRQVRRRHLRISCPAVHLDGLEEQPPQSKSVALPTEPPYSVTRLYSVCTHMYAYIHAYTCTNRYTRMHAYTIHMKAVRKVSDLLN